MPNSDPESQKSQKIGEDKFAILWNQRKERLERISQNFCYAPCIFIFVLYSVIFEDKISSLEFIFHMVIEKCLRGFKFSDNYEIISPNIQGIKGPREGMVIQDL